MRIALCGLILTTALASAQHDNAAPAPPAANALPTPRMADGTPSLTGIWQAGSTTPGSWEEANRGAGLGGTGTDAAAPIAPAAPKPRPRAFTRSRKLRRERPLVFRSC